MGTPKPKVTNLNWVAVKELNLIYHYGYRYICSNSYGSPNIVAETKFLNSNPVKGTSFTSLNACGGGKVRRSRHFWDIQRLFMDNSGLGSKFTVDEDILGLQTKRWRQEHARSNG